jgi:Xaa-Pro aminopeptidase
MLERSLDRSEVASRILALKVGLREQSLDGALFAYPIDVYYFSGTRQNATLWIPAEGEPVLLVRKSFTRAKNESLIIDTRPFPSSKDFPEVIGAKARRIGLTFDVLPVSYQQYYSSILNGIELLDISSHNREIRAVKSVYEQNCLRESGRKLMEIFSQAPDFLRPGMRELDLAAEFESRLRKAGNMSTAHMRAFGQEIIGLAVSGATAAEPGCFDGPVIGRGLRRISPFGSSENEIKNNSPILIDYPGIFSGYIVDATRIFAFGYLDRELSRAHAVALDIQQWVIENLRPGTICEDLYLGAVKIAVESGFGQQFMGCPGEQAKFIGHGVGLELDESPVLAKGFKVPLKAGNVIAIEPKFVFPGKGSVGIENTWLLTEAKAEKLTDLPDQIVYL